MPKDKATIYISAEDKTREAFTSVQRNLGQLQSAASELGGIFARLGVGLSLAGVAASIRSVAHTADEMGKLAQRTGVAVEEFSKLDYAAKLSDVSREELTNGLAQLSRRLLDAAAGSNEAREAFARISIDPTQFTSADQALKVIADRFKDLPDGAVKTATAMQLFGKSGAQLIPLLNDGASGLKALADEAERAGVVISKEADLAAREFNDNLTRLGQQLQGIRNNAIIPLLPTLTEISRELAGSGSSAKSAGTDFSALKGVLETVAVLGANVAFVFDGVGRSLGAAVAQASALVRGNLAEYRAILKELEADDKAARARLDAFEKRIFNPAVSAAASRQPAPSVGSAVGSSTAVAAADKAKKELQKIFDANRKLEAKNLRVEFDIEAANLDQASDAFIKARDEIARIKAEVIATIDPIEKYRQKLLEIDRALEAGAITPEQATEARFYWQEQIEGASDFGQAVKETSDFAKEFGLTFTSAMEDALVSGKKFSEVLKGLGDDLARIIYRKTITEPLGNAASKFLGSFDFGKLFGFADGGIMTSAGPLPLRTYAGGGVANSPQLALFGEGRTPEAFVPLPDGRSIPVKMQGGGHVVNITQYVSIDSRTDQASILSAMRTAKDQAKAEILTDMQRGGTFAKAAGRV